MLLFLGLAMKPDQPCRRLDGSKPNLMQRVCRSEGESRGVFPMPWQETTCDHAPAIGPGGRGECWPESCHFRQAAESPFLDPAKMTGGTTAARSGPWRQKTASSVRIADWATSSDDGRRTRARCDPGCAFALRCAKDETMLSKLSRQVLGRLSRVTSPGREYIPQLDGLRFVALLLVVQCHALEIVVRKGVYPSGLATPICSCFPSRSAAEASTCSL